MDPHDLTPSEIRLRDAFRAGADADFRVAGDDDPAKGAGWSADRTIRAEVIRDLLIGEVPVGAPPLRVHGAYVAGRLWLQYAEIQVAVLLHQCRFEEPPDMYWAQTRTIDLSHSWLPGLRAGHARIDGMISLQRATVTGTVVLTGASVSGAAILNGAHLKCGGGRALSGARLAVSGGIVCTDDFVAEGEVRLADAHIGESLDLTGAKLINPGGRTLSAWSMNVESIVKCEHGFRSEGKVSFTGAKIGSVLSFQGAALINQNLKALTLHHVDVRELIFDGATVDGAIGMRHGRVALLRMDPIPPAIELDGLVYGALEPHLPVSGFLDLLRRSAPGEYLPQPYQQLAETYRALGHDLEARTVRLAAERRRRAHLPWHARLWSIAQDVAVGYGYRPGRAMTWLMLLWAIGIVTFAAFPPQPIGENGPERNWVIYSLDVLLPVIDLGQERAFQPYGPGQWVAWILIAGGWFLATTVAAGVTRSLARP